MKREFWRYFDFWLFGAVLVLCVFGIAMIQSAIAGNAQLAGLPRSQTIYVVIGLAIVIIMAMIDYHYFASLSRMLYIFYNPVPDCHLHHWRGTVWFCQAY